MGEFFAIKDEYLVFENGPSTDIVLQWAKYRDASDQASLSRIWGGIHPPVDDIPGRLMGIEIGTKAFSLAELYFQGQITTSASSPLAITPGSRVYPNPITDGKLLTVELQAPLSVSNVVVQLYNRLGQLIDNRTILVDNQQQFFIKTGDMVPDMYLLNLMGNNWRETHKIIVTK